MKTWKRAACAALAACLAAGLCAVPGWAANGATGTGTGEGHGEGIVPYPRSDIESTDFVDEDPPEGYEQDPALVSPGWAFASNELFAYDFELPLKGSTGYGVIDMNVRAGDGLSTKKIGAVKAGAPFEILEEGETYLRVRLQDNTEGWVAKNYTMINLPDVLPSIVYKNTNGEASMFRSHGKDLSVTGKKLYDSKDLNLKLGCHEYNVPVLFNMAVKLAAIQRKALTDGNTLVIYEGYRPMSAQAAVRDALSALMKEDAAVRKSIDAWGSDWFIANGTSNHQQGYAIDVSLAYVTGVEAMKYGHYALTVPSEYVEYEMPTAMHDLSPAAATLAKGVDSLSKTAWLDVKAADTMTEGAKLLQKYCTDGGLTPLASEWWHFNDLDAREKTGGAGKGGFTCDTNMSSGYAIFEVKVDYPTDLPKFVPDIPEDMPVYATDGK